MRVIALVSQKGGTGKSLLALNLAVAAGLAGYRCGLLDLDPLRTVASWREARDAPGPLLLGSAGDTPCAATALDDAKHRVDLVFVDTPPGPASLATVIERADFCLLPVRPCEPDVRAVMPTLRALSALGRPYAIVINQAPPRPTSQAAGTIDRKGPVLSCAVTSRVDHQRAYAEGLGVQEYAPAGKAAAEIADLWHEVAVRMALRTSPRQARTTARVLRPALAHASSAAAPGRPSVAVAARLA